MTLNETMRKITGPTLQELVEKGDYKTSRILVWYSWIGMICMGFVIGVSFARLGWV